MNGVQLNIGDDVSLLILQIGKLLRKSTVGETALAGVPEMICPASWLARTRNIFGHNKIITMTFFGGTGQEMTRTKPDMAFEQIYM